MSRVYKRGKTWWCDLKGTEGRRRDRFSLHTEAKEMAIKRLALILTKRGEQSFFTKLNSVASLSSPPIGVGMSVNLKTDWIAKRWSSFNPREKYAIMFVLKLGKCTYCSEDVSIPRNRDAMRNSKMAVIDHIRPQSGGGGDNFDNLTLSCAKCNCSCKCNCFMKNYLEIF